MNWFSLVNLPCMKVGRGNHIPGILSEKARLFAESQASNSRYGHERLRSQIVDAAAEVAIGLTTGGVVGLIAHQPLLAIFIGLDAGLGHELIANVLIGGFYAVHSYGTVHERRMRQVLNSIATMRDYAQHKVAAVATITLFYTSLIGIVTFVLLHQFLGFAVGAAYGLVHSSRIVRKATKLMRSVEEMKNSATS